MSASNKYDLTPDIPQEALDARDAHPDDMLLAYNYVNAATEGYDNRNGDLATLIESANSNGQIVYCPAGEYEMDTGVSEYSGIVGVVGDGSGLTTIHYSGQDYKYLFNLNLSTFVLEGLTVQLGDYPGTGNTDVGLANADLSNECWCDDVYFRGKRELNQNLGSGWERVGGRFTFLIEMTSTTATSHIHDVHFPDGGTDRHKEIGDTEGHAIGPNADPNHVGTNVWHNCSCAGFADNGFYTNNSPGRNVLWNCEAYNNCTGNFRLGNNDYLIGCYAEITDTPDGRFGQGLVVNSGDNVTAIGFDGYGSGDAYGSELIVVRSEAQSVLLDRCVGHVAGTRRVARLSGSNANITVKDCYWYDEATSHSGSAIYLYGADVTATNLRCYSPNTELYYTSGSFSHNGTSYSTGTYQASQVGFDDPRPLPTFYFEGEAVTNPNTANLAFHVSDSRIDEPIEGAEVIVRREN